ncbi:hypothetical protein ACO2Q0_19105 [Phenylobacterium sp. VNQ135]|uniref:hypothetical protein n=1 Tax=Phenylobacterium sp. VNQ135 TaxID=3400922 RepID=UPI003C0B48E5
MARARLTLTTLLAAAALPAAARAGETACWFEGGVVVVPAEVAGIAGDYVLDTGQPVTQLHETKAQAEGVATEDVEAPSVTGNVRVAGLTLEPRTIPVADLDYRGWNLPTPIVGVLGADILKDLVVDVTFAPCRVRLSRPGSAPAFRAAASLPLAWDAGRPVVEARVEDGAHVLRGLFAPATGQPAAVRLADDVAAVSGTDRPQELGPAGVWLARLAELRLAGRRLADQAAGLEPAQGEAAGAIGAPALAHYRLRFDFPGGRLQLAPAR